LIFPKEKFHPQIRATLLLIDVGSPKSEDHKLIIRVIYTFELTHHIRTRYTTTSRIDGRTDGQLTIAIPR